MSEYDAFGKAFSDTRKKPWPEFELLQPLLQKSDRVLDLGCGNGRLRDSLPLEVIPQGNYFGLDLSEVMLQVARKHHPYEHFFRSNFSKELPFGKENFDVVTAIASFHHLLKKEHQLALLKEAHRVLKPGGVVFVTTWKIPGKHRIPNWLKGRFKNWVVPFGKHKDPRTYRRVNAGELRRLLKKAGFKVEHAKLFENRNYVAIARKK